LATRARRELGTAGAVRVFDYQCRSAHGDPPQDERFGRPAISIVRSGVFGYRDGARTQLLTAGFLLLGEPGTSYEVSHEHGGGDRCTVFHFDEAAFDELAGGRARRSGRRYFARSVLPPVPRVDAIRQLVEQRLAEHAPALAVEELAFALAASVLEDPGAAPRRPPSPQPDSRRARDQVYDALALLQQASTEELHLDDLAGAVGLSPYHFLRLFKRELGVTPYRFLVQARVRHAVELLRTTDRPVTDIAFDVGFGDLSNFINAFRREIGVSPGHFRKHGLAAARTGTTRSAVAP
nr:helix-turn-helix transcriptional regulator [Myxococcota bacterium]